MRIYLVTSPCVGLKLYLMIFMPDLAPRLAVIATSSTIIWLRPAVLSKGVTHFYEPLDAERMHRAAQCLLGENDFTSFRAVQCQSRPRGATLCILMSRVTVLMWW